jgi:hypothetical protein
MNPNKIDAAKFWSRVVIKGRDDCWEWQAGKTWRGYGDFNAENRAYRAHRISYWLKHGPIPDGQCVCHKCDNRGCVNPDHLFLGTKGENTKDMWRKGRAKLPRGDSHWKRVLNSETVMEIRKRYALGGISQSALARSLGLARVTVHKVINRTAWTHV